MATIKKWPVPGAFMARRLVAFQYFGGKNHLVSRIVPIIDSIPHRAYVEVFGGSAAVLLNKRPAETEVYNDINQILANFFMVLADPEKFNEFYRCAAVLPFSRQIFYDMLERMNNEPDPVWRAVAFYVAVRQSFVGKMNTWGYATVNNRNLNHAVSRWLGDWKASPQSMHDFSA